MHHPFTTTRISALFERDGKAAGGLLKQKINGYHTEAEALQVFVQANQGGSLVAFW